MLGPPSAHLLWFKGRRHLSSRNDFNWARLETARIATPSQQLLSVACNGELGLANFQVSRDPPTMLCPGAGDGSRSHGLRLNHSIIPYHIRMTAATWSCWGDRDRPFGSNASRVRNSSNWHPVRPQPNWIGGWHPHGLARRHRRSAMPLSRGRERRTRHLDLRSERQPSARSLHSLL